MCDRNKINLRIHVKWPIIQTVNNLTGALTLGFILRIQNIVVVISFNICVYLIYKRCLCSICFKKPLHRRPN